LTITFLLSFSFLSRQAIFLCFPLSRAQLSLSFSLSLVMDNTQRCWFEIKNVKTNQAVRVPLRHDLDEARVAVGDVDYTLGGALYHALYTHPRSDTVGNEASDQERHIVFPVLTTDGSPAVQLVQDCARDLVQLFACIEQRLDAALPAGQ
jgi:hypothetical protein